MKCRFCKREIWYVDGRRFSWVEVIDIDGAPEICPSMRLPIPHHAPFVDDVVEMLSTLEKELQ